MKTKTALMRGGAMLLLALSACGDDPGDENGTQPTPGNGTTMEPVTQTDSGAAQSAPEAGAAAGDAGTQPAVDATTASGTDASSQSSTTRPADGGATPAPTNMPAMTDYEAAKTLVGSYAAVIKYRDVITVGLAGTGSLVTTVYATAEIKDDPAAQGVKLGMSPCDARVGQQTKHLLDLEIAIPKTALSGTTFEPVPLKISRVDGKISWKADDLQGVAGWKRMSATDEMPKRADDPRVFDYDTDSQPGVTAAFSGHAMGSVYLGLSYRFSFSGSTGANGELSGATISTSREALLGSTEILLGGATIDRVADADTADNTVRLVRQSGALTCDQLIAQRDTLFP